MGDPHRAFLDEDHRLRIHKCTAPYGFEFRYAITEKTRSTIRAVHDIWFLAKQMV